jgi:hypothetical protein
MRDDDPLWNGDRQAYDGELGAIVPDADGQFNGAMVYN